MRYKPDIVKAYYLSQGLPAPVFEFRFLQDRRFRFDIAWPKSLLALEVEGGVWTGGAHGRGVGIRRDIEKGNLALANGWRVLRCFPKEVCMLDTVNLIKKVMSLCHTSM